MQKKTIQVTFLAMNTVVENTTVYDTVLQNVDVLAAKAHIAHVGGLSHPTTLSLVNITYGQHWYRPDPDTPTYTITVVLETAPAR